MLNLKFVITKKYELERGTKLFLKPADGADFETSGEIAIITTDTSIKNMKLNDEVGVKIGS